MSILLLCIYFSVLFLANGGNDSAFVEFWTYKKFLCVSISSCDDVYSFYYISLHEHSFTREIKRIIDVLWRV